MSNKIILAQSDAKAILGLTHDAATWNVSRRAVLQEISEALDEATRAAVVAQRATEIIFSIKPK